MRTIKALKQLFRILKRIIYKFCFGIVCLAIILATIAVCLAVISLVFG